MNENKIKTIGLADFPNNMFIELPAHYRKALFKIAICASGSMTKLKFQLNKRGYNSNIENWISGYDKGRKQLVNLDSLLWIVPLSRNKREYFLSSVNLIKLQINQSQKRIAKSRLLVTLFKDIRNLLGGVNGFSKKFNINSGTLRSYINEKKIKKVPVLLVNEIINFVEDEVLVYHFSLDELQNKIISYKAAHGKTIFLDTGYNESLPLKVTPEFESIIYHLLGDGHIKPIGSGEYTQLNPHSKSDFLYKLYNCFGHFSFSDYCYIEGRILIPKAIVKIILSHYALNYKSFHWDISNLPDTLSPNKDYKVAGLAAFIVDEGHVSNKGIEIYSSNKKLLSQIKDIIRDLNLNCTEVKNKKADSMSKKSYRLRIPKKESLKLSKMIDSLQNIYPHCGLAHKKQRLLS